MPVRLLLIVSLAISLWALWLRRSSFGCRWEGAPTLVAASAAVAAYLTSGHASEFLADELYRLTGGWNYEDFLGHHAAILCAGAAVYMCLVRLEDAPTVQAYYTQWVVLPLTVASSLLQATWEVSPATDAYLPRFEDLEPDRWLALYWCILCVTLIYLLLLAGRIVWLLKIGEDQRATVLHMWMATFGVTIMFLLLINFHVLSTFDLTGLVWTVGYVATSLWALTPGYSWYLKSRPLTVPTQKAPPSHVDSDAERVRDEAPSAHGDSDDL